ncbi:hypothetical protein Tco_1184178 [Tanacetum coccineum]
MDSLSFDDLYNNLRVFENDVNGSNASSSNLQNVAFVSENTSSTNDVSTAHGVSNTLVIPQSHDNHHIIPCLQNGLKNGMWQLISMRIKKFYKKNGRKLQFDAKETVRFDKTKWNATTATLTGILQESVDKEDSRRRVDGILEIKMGKE